MADIQSDLIQTAPDALHPAIPAEGCGVLAASVRHELARMPKERQNEFSRPFRTSPKASVMAYLTVADLLSLRAARSWAMTGWLWMSLVVASALGVVWWLIDLVRMPAMVREHNHRVASRPPSTSSGSPPRAPEAARRLLSRPGAPPRRRPAETCVKDRSGASRRSNRLGRAGCTDCCPTSRLAIKQASPPDAQSRCLPPCFEHRRPSARSIDVLMPRAIVFAEACERRSRLERAICCGRPRPMPREIALSARVIEDPAQAYRGRAAQPGAPGACGCAPSRAAAFSPASISTATPPFSIMEGIE